MNREQERPPRVPAPLWPSLVLLLSLPLGAETQKMEIRPGHRAVESVQLLRKDAGRLDWSAQGDQIAFDAIHENGFYDIFLMSPDGGAAHCLTCTRYELRKAHAFNPTWHPSGKWIVMQVREKALKVELTIEQMASPNRAFRSELWAVTVDGRDMRRLTNIGERGGILTDPFFSFEAGKLAWSERFATREGRWGHWGLRVATISSGRSGIVLGEADLFEPVAGLVLGQAFAASDREVYVVTLADEASAPSLGSIDLETGEWRVLPGISWGSAPMRLSPRNDWVVWSSSRGASKGRGLSARSDLWRARVDGSKAERLTYFNEQDYEFHTGETLVADVSWDPEGKRLALQLVIHVDGLTTERIVLLELSEAM